jgi:hypothetical protein
MFFIHGTYTRTKPRGILADHCRHCGKATRFQLTQYYEVAHLNFIPLGSGKLVKSQITCLGCGTPASTELMDYLGVVPDKRAGALSMGEVLDETNPRLAIFLAALAQIENGEPNAIDRKVPNAGLQDISRKLWDLGPHHPTLNMLLPRLRNWPKLSASIRDRLSQEIDTIHEEFILQDRRRLFLLDMAKAFKPDVDPGLSILTLLLVCGVGIAGSVMFLPKDSFEFLGIVVSIVAGIVCLALVQWWRRRAAHYRFFLTILLPQATSRGIDLARFIEELHAYRPGDSKLDKKIKAMAGSLPILKRIFQEQGVALEPAQSAESPRTDAEGEEDPVLFLMNIGKTYKPKDAGLTDLLAGVGVAFLFLIGGPLTFGEKAIFPCLILALVGGAVGATWVHRRLERRRQVRFFRKTLVPEAQKRGVDLNHVVEALAAIRGQDSAVEHPLHSLARSWQALDKMVQQG